MKDIIDAIKSNELSKEYLTVTEAIADIDQKLKARVKTCWWKNEEDLLSEKEKVILRAERQLLAKALMDIVQRMNGEEGWEAAKIGISVDVQLPAPKK